LLSLARLFLRGPLCAAAVGLVPLVRIGIPVVLTVAGCGGEPRSEHFDVTWAVSTWSQNVG
jgi:hypothetical protein